MMMMSIALVTTSHLIKLFQNDMKIIRNNCESEFELIENDATELVQKCDITFDYKQLRVRKIKRFHEKIAEDDGICCPKEIHG